MERGLVIKREAQNIQVYVFEKEKILRGIPKGRLREKERIFAGDYVQGETEKGDVFLIEKIEERKNILIRPPVANVDCVIVITSLKEPEFNNFLLDNLLVVYECENVDICIVFNKIDLLDKEDFKELEIWKNVYEKAGYEVYTVSAEKGINIEKLKERIRDGIYIFAGASGTGKSSILSAITGIELRKGEVSKKTGRGRHTTTGVSLIKIGKNTYVGDTPGFSKVYANMILDRGKIKEGFREFLNYECRFADCMHINEKGCGVKEAVEKGEIARERYESYLRIVGKQEK